MHSINRAHAFRAILFVVLCMTASSCTNLYYYGPSGLLGGTRYLEGYDSHDPRYANQQADSESWWRGSGVPGNPSIVLSLGRQRAYFYKGGRLVGMSIISSGDEQHPTPRGSYTIQQKDQRHQSSQYGDYIDAERNIVQTNIDRNVDPMPPGTRFDGANMFYFMRLTRGIGMHAGYLPGYPASHGCVRMPERMAELFFNNVRVGTPVDVRW